MKKFLYTICLALVCCLLQGCSSEQTAILDEGVEASLETIGVNKRNIEDGKFSFGLDEVNFLLKVKNESDAIYEINEEKIEKNITPINQDGEVNFLLKVKNESDAIYEINEEKIEKNITPINQDGEIEGSLQVDVTNVEKVKPKKTEGVIVRLALKDLDINYDSIGLMINNEKFLVTPSDERIQILYGFTLDRTSAVFDNKDISIDFNIHELRSEDNIDFVERYPDSQILEYDYNVTNKTDRMLILPKILTIQADNYRTNNFWNGTNLLDSDNFNDVMSEAKEKDAIIANNDVIKYLKEGQANNDVIKYLKEGQDLTLEEIN
ncbi:hypothetical protein, partial [Holdemanella porci]|uniref:hypothetical protein n=1 Tax=Holdemanella porci TaxID=2652276 RepID=UPI0022E89173